MGTAEFNAGNWSLNTIIDLQFFLLIDENRNLTVVLFAIPAAFYSPGGDSTGSMCRYSWK